MTAVRTEKPLLKPPGQTNASLNLAIAEGVNSGQGSSSANVNEWRESIEDKHIILLNTQPKSQRLFVGIPCEQWAGASELFPLQGCPGLKRKSISDVGTAKQIERVDVVIFQVELDILAFIIQGRTRNGTSRQRAPETQ